MYWPGMGASKGSCGYPFLSLWSSDCQSGGSQRSEDLEVLVEYEWPPNCGVDSPDEKDVR